MTSRDPTAAARSFYGRWARLYDVVARGTPGVGRVRRRAAGALDPAPGDAVVEMGCGTGANLPYLQERVGPDGVVAGLDFTGPVLARAARRGRREGWPAVSLLRGDATRPPVSGPVDGVVASFVTGMLADPAAAVDRWLDLLAPGGRLVLVDAARSRRAGASAAAVNAAFRAFLRVSSPPGTTARHDDPAGVLDARVGAAHDRLATRGRVVDRGEHLLGLVRLTAAEV